MYTYIYIYIYVHIYMYTYIYIYMYTYIVKPKNWINTDPSNLCNEYSHVFSSEEK